MPCNGPVRATSRMPTRVSRWIPRTSQNSEPRTVTAPLGKRCISLSSTRLPPIRPDITRPLVAPRSTAATRTGSVMARAHRRNAAATPASTGMCRPVVWVSSGPQRTKTALAMWSGSTSRLRIVRWA